MSIEEKKNQNEKNLLFEEYWIDHGVDFSSDLYFFAQSRGGLIIFTHFSEEPDQITIKIQYLLDQYCAFLSNERSIKAHSVIKSTEIVFENLFNIPTEAELYQKYSWSLYEIIKRKHLKRETLREIVFSRDPDFFSETSIVDVDRFGVFPDEILFDYIEHREKRVKHDSKKKMRKYQNKSSDFVKRTKFTKTVNAIPFCLIESDDQKNGEADSASQTGKETINKGLEKYWHMRYRLFSMFDEGIQLDQEGWYSVTHEEIAIHHAERLACDLIVDPFCGCGGNVIQFAKTCKFVVAGDYDIEKLKICVSNSKVYGVQDNIDFIRADALYLINCIKSDACFSSPPWGGPSYIYLDSFNVATDLVPSAFEIFKNLNPSCKSAALYLPRNVAFKPLKKIAKFFFNGVIEVEKNFLNKKLVACTVYFGDSIIT